MSERIKMIAAYEGGGYAVSEYATEYGVSRKTVYKWIERYEAVGGPLNLEVAQVFEHNLFVFVRESVLIFNQPGLGLSAALLPFDGRRSVVDGLNQLFQLA